MLLNLLFWIIKTCLHLISTAWTADKTLPISLIFYFIHQPHTYSRSSPLHWKRSFRTARLFCPWNSPGKNTGVDCHSLLQEIFLTQESNLGLLHFRQILYYLSHQGSPWLFLLSTISGFIYGSHSSVGDRQIINPS